VADPQNEGNTYAYNDYTVIEMLGDLARFIEMRDDEVID
jgi:hypothetical protein